MYFTGCCPSIAGPRAYFMPIFSANLHWSHRNIWIDGGKNMARSLFKEKIISYGSYRYMYCVCLTLFISSSRKLTSWLCFLSDLYPDLDSWRCPGKHWTWQSSQGHTANLATLVSLPQCRAHGPSPALPILHTPLAITKFHSIALQVTSLPHYIHKLNIL